MTSKLLEKSEDLGKTPRREPANEGLSALQKIHLGDLISFEGHYMMYSENLEESVFQITPTLGLAINIKGSVVTVCTDTKFCMINCASDYVTWRIMSDVHE